MTAIYVIMFNLIDYLINMKTKPLNIIIIILILINFIQPAVKILNNGVTFMWGESQRNVEIGETFEHMSGPELKIKIAQKQFFVHNPDETTFYKCIGRQQ